MNSENENNEEELNNSDDLDQETQNRGFDERAGDEGADRDADFSDLQQLQLIEQLQSELKEAKQEASVNNTNHLRALADFENFKKRSLKERSELMRYEGEKLVVDFLEVMDNFERALEHKDSDADNLRAGIEMILKQFSEVFTKWQVMPESCLNKPFDPNVANALSIIEVPDSEPNTVVQEFKKPYSYKGKLVRQGEVVVSSGESNKTDDGDVDEKSTVH